MQKEITESQVINPPNLADYLPVESDKEVHERQVRLAEYLGEKRLTLHDIRKRTKAAIEYIIDNDIDGVVNAPPSSGKSRGTAKVLAEMDVPAAYFAPRRELYEQMKEWCREEGLTVKVLPSMTRDCESYEEGNVAYNLYNRGMKPSKIHNEVEACSVDCTYMKKLPQLDDEEMAKYVPLDQFDVLIGHTHHAYVEPYIRNRVVVFDDISKRAFIDDHAVEESKIRVILENDAFPCDTVGEIYETRANEVDRFIATSRLDSMHINPWSDDEQTTHADARMIVETVLNAEGVGNGFGRYHYVPEDEERQEYIGVKDGNHHVYLLKRPPLTKSPKSVILLNAYPITHASEPTWFNWRTGIRAKLVQPLTLEERREYISDILNIDVIQTTDYIKPYSSGKKEYMSLQKDSKLIRYIAQQHNTEVPVITPNKALSRFKQRDLPVEEYMNFARVESSNAFGDKKVGLVIGSPEWKNHHHTKLIGAFMDQHIEWNGERGVDKSFGEVGDSIMKGFREYMVGQAILRFGREAQGATVYVHTSAIPENIPIAEKFDTEIGDSYVSTGYQILQYMLGEDTEVFETSELYDNILATRRSVTDTLNGKDIFKRVREGKGPKPAKWTISDESREELEHLN